MKQHGSRSYGNILKSSVLIGGSSLITILAAILRTKFVAVFLGPAGIGLMGLFSSMTGMVGTLVGMGITTSGVRKIAEAAGNGDEIQVARTATALRRIVFWLGLLGTVLLAVFCVPASRLTFGTPEHAGKIALLSLAIVAGAVAEGQAALLQGFRRMGHLAKIAILGAAVSLAFTLPVVYLLRQDAVVALLLVASGAGLLSAWWYASKVKVAPVSMTWRDTVAEARSLLRIGLASMSAGLMVAAIAYVVRVVIVRYLGFEAAGIYQAAAALSGAYCGFILSAMAADFLPRVSAAASDDAECNRLVNEQAEVGLLLAFPGICATLAFSPLIIEVLYSGQFGLATEVLRWQVLGIFLRVASWPMGYLLIAKGKAQLYFWTEVAYNGLHAGLIWIGVRLWGLPGTGIAFFGLYVCYFLLMSLVTRRLTGFSWSTPNKRLALATVPSIALVFLCRMLLPAPWHFISAVTITALAGLYSLRTLLSLVGRQGIRESFAGQIQLLRSVGLKAAGFLK